MPIASKSDDRETIRGFNRSNIACIQNDCTMQSCNTTNAVMPASKARAPSSTERTIFFFEAPAIALAVSGADTIGASSASEITRALLKFAKAGRTGSAACTAGNRSVAVWRKAVAQ